MKRIEAILEHQEMLCVEAAAGPCVCGVRASGDLAHRKLYAGLYELFRRDLMSRRFYSLGCGRTEFSDEAFRDKVRQSLNETLDNPDGEMLETFLKHLYYTAGDYSDKGLYERLCAKMKELDAAYDVEGARIFYLSVPPVLYGEIADKLGALKLNCPAATGRFEQVRLVVEKPFGRDLDSAKELDRLLGRHFQESQIYRIDHYLGKETVQNLLIFRFANSLFEPVWNRNYIDHIQITIAETLGVEHRANYYDKSGALRDMFQNHILQMLALVAMEPPVSFEADRVRDEKVKLLRGLRPLTPEDAESSFIRGQYGPGQVDGKAVRGYLEEEGVAADSATETYVAAKLYVDNWRWKGVPFYLRTGKRLARRLTEIAITFRHVPHSMFMTAGLEDMPPMCCVFRSSRRRGCT